MISRIGALLLRSLYLYKRSVARLMGIVVDHIQNEFSSLDSEQLSGLRE